MQKEISEKRMEELKNMPKNARELMKQLAGKLIMKLPKVCVKLKKI